MTDTVRDGGWAELAEHDGRLVAPGEEWRSEPYRISSAQFIRCADVLDLSDDLRSRLLEPRRSLTVNFPVRMDDGTVQNFTGYSVQHTLTVGPTKGAATRPASRSASARPSPCG